METFENAYSDAVALYAIETNKEDFDELALIAWNKIGNKLCRLYRFIAHTDECNKIELPCNCTIVESVNYLIEDWKESDTARLNGNFASLHVEEYIEARKYDTPALYNKGKYAKYRQVGNYLYFEHPCVVCILYKGVEVDEDGLPCITQKESFAIATYVAYSERLKRFLISGTADPSIEYLKKEWDKACSNARSPMSMSQNEHDEILNVMSTWNRKIFGKSFKPIL